MMVIFQKVVGRPMGEKENIKEYVVWQRENERNASITFNDGCLYICTSNVIFFSAKDVFMQERKEVRVRDFIGKAKLTDAEAVNKARQLLLALGCDSKSFNLEKPPQIRRPFFLDETISVPRMSISWSNSKGGVFSAAVLLEMDTTDGRLVYLNIYRDDP